MCDHGFIGACAECDGSGQQPEAPETNGCDCQECQDCRRIMGKPEPRGFRARPAYRRALRRS